MQSHARGTDVAAAVAVAMRPLVPQSMLVKAEGTARPDISEARRSLNVQKTSVWVSGLSALGDWGLRTANGKHIMHWTSGKELAVLDGWGDGRAWPGRGLLLRLISKR